jgi:hypothetical protein
LDEKLFSRLDLLNITFKSQIDVVQKRQAKVKREQYYQYMNESAEANVRREADDFEATMKRELQNIQGTRPSVRYCSADGRYNTCRNRGRINLNLGFGNRRNRGNINIGTGW